MFSQRLLFLVVWYVCIGVSEELVPPSSGFLLKLHLRVYYHTAGRLSLKDNNFRRKHYRENLISYELNFSNFANTNNSFGSRHFCSICEVAVVYGVTAVCETELHLTSNIYCNVKLFCLVVCVADCPGTVGITSEIQCFPCYWLRTNIINK